MVGRPSHNGQGRSGARRGFTLIELLVAIGILMVISALTFSMVNVTMDSDRIRSGSREIQSYLEGARNQAIYAKQPRGVRFLLNPDDPSTVNSMLYIGPPSNYSQGQITVTAPDQIATIAPLDWTAFESRGLLINGARIKIPKDGTEWYTMSKDGVNWRLTKPFVGTFGTQTYQVEFAPAVLPNQEPRLLPRGVVIDLDNSPLPTIWGTTVPYSNQMDVLFSPQGTVIGTLGAAGRIHFVLSDTNDTNLNITEPALTPRQRLYPPWQAGNAYAAGQWVVPNPDEYLAYRCLTGGNAAAPAPAGEPGQTVPDGGGVQWQCFARRRNLVVSLVTQTGNVASYPADVTVRAPATVADPFYYAETGEVAK